MSLDRLLRPRSIAVIGGGAWCANVIEQCRRIGFAGTLHAVHPTRAEVGGLATVADISALPAPPDAAFVGINRDGTIPAVRALAAMGAGGAVCFAAGFREAQAETTDGAAMQAGLLEAAGDMTILGPNCYGFLNYLDGAALWPDQHGGRRVERGVAIVTQSSNVALNLTMQRRGLPLAYVVTAGNQAQTGVAAIARALVADARVTALGLHIEGIDDLRGVEALAREAHARGIPVVALKVGRSEAARAATVSHTASLAGSDAGARALFARLGIGQAASLPVLLETLKLLHVTGPLASNRIASMSCSGGEASLVADAAEGLRLRFPPLDATQTPGLRAALGPAIALANPLDYNTRIWGDVDAMTRTFTAMMQGDLALGCVVLDIPRADRCDPSGWAPTIAAIEATHAATTRPMAVLATLPEGLPEVTADDLLARGLVPLSGIDEALAAIEVAAHLAPPDPAPLLPPDPHPDARLLTEAQAKAALAAHGVPVPAHSRATSPSSAARDAAALGFPVALKGEGIAHKTEAGAVALNLTSASQVRRAAAAMPTTAFLVERMVESAVAELLVGVVADPAHGYVLTLAAGGTYAELLDDRASLLLPASPEAIRAALDRLRIAPVLRGYRGRPAASLDAIVAAVLAVQACVAALRPTELEINPLICTPDRAVAADALITAGDPA